MMIPFGQSKSNRTASSSTRPTCNSLVDFLFVILGGRLEGPVGDSPISNRPDPSVRQCALALALYALNIRLTIATYIYLPGRLRDVQVKTSVG